MGLNLLDLPVDILYLILRPLVVSRAPIPLCPCAGAPSDIRPLPVLLSHPAVHAVACPLLYEGNIFVLDVRGDHGPHVRRCLEEARAAAEDKDGEGRQGLATASDLDDDGEDDAMAAKRGPLLLQRGALRRMSRVEVRIAKLRAWLQSLAVPVLADMAMGGTLSELLVYVHDSSGAGHGRNNPTGGS
ncbi:hypothetical protein HIM_03186 [Hirsutella minnesotensis 3608]|nr:hypothetical protein HIM_03186 [Hirsutella minnesotensis 3608]